MSGRVGSGCEWTYAEPDQQWWGEMAERAVPEALAALNLATIEDVGAREALRALSNLVEELVAEVQALRAELAQVKDENARGSARVLFLRVGPLPKVY